jgi:hypothetical protein
MVATDLGIDEAIDAFVAETRQTLPPEPAGDLLGRPAGLQLAEDPLAQGGIAIEPTAIPASRLRLGIGIKRLIAHLTASVALQLPGDGRWRAIQSCSDLPDRGTLA